MKNQRKCPRLVCAVPVEGQAAGVFDQTQTVDFSRGGLGFVSQQPIPLNHKIAVELDLEEQGNPVFVIGRVKWVRPEPVGGYRVGMEFESILRGSKSRIDQYFRDRV
ncbi:MAG: PilZ domain-containing protein [Candidatus Omnitrophica bacterium]|nr:PilZ domain-containing protein [Candidatus Omnitrophota bacterium]